MKERMMKMKRILVVDDASFMRATLRMMLERNEYKVIGEAVNGMDAVVKYAELKPDIVTMDITMPEMSGIEAVRAIKVLDPDARIVMISAMGQETMVRESIMAGAEGFLVKPFQEGDVIKVLSKM